MNTDLLPSSAPTAPAIPRRQQWLLLLGWISVLTGLAIWLRTPGPILREQLKIAQFWSLEVCLVLLVCLAGVLVTRVAARLDRRDVVTMAALAATGVCLTIFVAPQTNRIYYDELIYQEIGQNLSDLKRAQMCNDGTVEYGRLQCWSGEYNKEPYAYPHLLSVFYRVFGVSEPIAHAVNAAANAVTVCSLYLMVLLVFGDRRAAAFAGLLLALLPEQLLWSATASVEPSASMACVVALLCAAWFWTENGVLPLAATGVATVYAVQFRPESLLIIPVVAVVVASRTRRDLAGTGFWWLGLLLVSLAAVHLGHMTAVRGESWGTSGPRLSVAYLPVNLRVNGLFYLWDERFPPIVTALSLLGLIGRARARWRAALATYFASFFAVYLVFYAGSYNFGADVRYSLMTYPPLAALAGLGLSRIAAWLQPSMPRLRIGAALAAALFVQFLWYAPLVRAKGEEAWAARADVEFARSLVPRLRGNSYVLTHNPGMFHVWGVNAGQMSLVVNNPQFLNYLATRYAGGVYLHWNFWCNVQDPVQRDFCRQATAGKRLTLLGEHRERTQRLALYRIEGVPAADLRLQVPKTP